MRVKRFYARLERIYGGGYQLHRKGEVCDFPLDWDYPALASHAGLWSHEHGETDGTITCPVCGKTAGEMISEADDILREREGSRVDCTAYFEAGCFQKEGA